MTIDTVYAVFVTLALIAHIASTETQLRLARAKQARTDATLAGYRVELDELQKFRSYSLLLMRLDEDKKQMDEMMVERGLDPIWKKPQE